MKMLGFFFAVILSSTTVFADWAQDFAELKNIPRSYEDSGSICEEIARLDLQKEFPAPQYEVIVGIAYGDATRVIGELDVVIFDKNIQKVIKIAEVKCWKDMRGGLQKALEQRARFLKSIRSSKQLVFKSTSTKEVFDAEKFEYVEEFFTMGQKGTVAVGYEREMEYTHKEMQTHRYEMIRCQNQGQCVRP
ncbi:hypothetical protein QJS83_12005 [Bdellovibrio sp. 22V]|uniref:hypothetical protein n=1 Tax=Bdellovibrio TaxID=958 RepID=UPI002543771C|nr:hypothetical protein [Bdellovibrio sp. 22V]WII71184.1 hypothetical protein QJS83_12005 [Bdellovibrio sp. 22V]